jgi:hypothetical protein
MPQQFLHGPDVIAHFKQMSGKGVAKRVAAHWLAQPG